MRVKTLKSPSRDCGINEDIFDHFFGCLCVDVKMLQNVKGKNNASQRVHGFPCITDKDKISNDENEIFGDNYFFFITGSEKISRFCCGFIVYDH